MELLSPSRHLEKSPFKDVTNSTPTPGIVNSSRKQSKPKLKRFNSTSVHTPQQRRSTRLSSLKADVDEKENVEWEEEQRTVKISKTRRKVTPSGGGSVTTRKRSRKDGQDSEILVSGRRTRSSISTLPSSPLAGKTTPRQSLSTPIRPRLTRSNPGSMSAKSNKSTQSRSELIPVIAESHLETCDGRSPSHPH